MQRLKNSLFNLSILLNCLLVFLLIFEASISIPMWLQVAGRMHPMLLHFPLVLMVLYAVILICFYAKYRGDEDFTSFIDALLLAAALTAALTAVIGLLLSKEAGYDPASLAWHKWSGTAVSILALLWYIFRKALHSKKLLALSVAVIAVGLVTFAGHQGASITHGDDFLTGPLRLEDRLIAIDLADAEVYTHMVKPILQAKCIGCHNNTKAKGGLVMDTEAQLLKGGKSGVLWDLSEPDLGLMLRRVHLPVEDKKHMPPVGKTQLTPLEITILSQWIKKGADFNLRVAKLESKDTLYTIAANLLRPKETESYSFESAAESTIRQLNTANRVVLREAANSPGLVVNFFHSRLFKPEQLRDLLAVKEQIVSLDLAKMPIKDVDLNLVSELENLRMLNLNFTNITGLGLAELKKLKYLKTLALSGTAITARDLQQLKGFAKLKKVFLWSTPVSGTELAQLKQQFKAIHLESGFKGDSIVLKLAEPIIEGEEAVFRGSMPLVIKHYINGVKIRYTTDGSEPDSVHSLLYKGPEVMTGKTFVKAKAYKPGWISSNLVQKNFYTSKYVPDTAVFMMPPEPGYSGKSKMLHDFVTGNTNFRLGNWLAWRFTKMDVLMKFGKPALVQNVTLSGLIDVGSYIMPPKDIEIWGGNDENQLKLLGRVSPEQPTMVKAPFLTAFEVKFSPATVKFMRIKVTPVFSLPSWHPGKGDKAWVFFDEVMVN
ncbi:FN3 associated domain-containing protein [Pedobacter insulae]|uniref:Uncharacterized membrane protein n=1 Tax=Pedobacter insulae TaxID=414048 RepID=A0A1I2YM17_9SPHI|nr:FN3 associated domain-containing protein [Pedobacter insulae]SFH25651.1 Uncharacterized membrane protein [Pedobacter insulae]